MNRIRLVAPIVLAALLGALDAAAQSWGPGIAPSTKAATAAPRLHARPGSIPTAQLTLPAPDPDAIQALQHANRISLEKRLEIGIGREIAPTDLLALTSSGWTAIEGGRVAHWNVASGEARALRLALHAAVPDARYELRFAGAGRPDIVYGPFTAADVASAGAVYWSPVLEGDTAIVELYVDGASPDPGIELTGLSHLFVDPADPKAESLAKAAGACEVNLICKSVNDAQLAQVGRSVARMAFTSSSGGTAFCTGTLLNPSDNSFTPYFISAAHCISTQTAASTLTTWWYYEAATCTGSALNLNPANVQIPGGAALIYANTDSDFGLLRLNSNPPSSAIYAGWDAAPLSKGLAVTAVHHADADVKKVSYGTLAGFDTPVDPPGSFARVQWNSIATGVVEPGSSGSALLTGNSSSGYRVRGGLLGGLSSCTAPTAELFDYYSRFDLAYPFIAQYLNPSGAPAAGANAVANPGFEGGAGGWTPSSTNIITNDSSVAHGGSWYAWLGGATDLTETLAQTITIPDGPARLQFWYRIATGETTTSGTFDRLTVSLVNINSGATITTLTTLSNLNATNGWVLSPVFDVSASGGQAVRLQFRATNDFSLPTSFRIDDVTVNGVATTASTNPTSLWWNASESGWGLNVNNQGNIAFATLFTYDSNGAPMWLVMSDGRRQNGGDAFTGTLYRTIGPAFNANPFPPIGTGNVTDVGAMTLDFSAAGASIGYTVNDTYVSKTIEKQVYGSRAAICTGTTASRAGATNYQDLWWNAAESGWGINLAHQGNIIFATLFSYGADGKGMWLVMSAGVRQSDGSYVGELYRTTGPVFNAQPWTPINSTTVGTMRLRFANGENATLDYTVNGVAVSKAITRQVFSSPVPLCSG